VAEILAPIARTKKLEMSVAPIDPALSLLADSERVKQILINLIGNAIKFTPAGGRVNVACRATDSAVEIEVGDTGLGIPEISLERVFEPFVRLRNSAGESGTGLGLSISRDLARAMNGTLIVRSVYGKGSRFILTLPRSTRLAREP
jgi:signal transduction histidine kinase